MISTSPATYIGIDTNVLLRFLLRDDLEQYEAARQVFAGFSPEHRGFITQITLAETYWVLSRSIRLSRDECLTIIRHLFESDSIEFDDGEGVARALVFAEDHYADFGDALIQGTMELFGIDRIVTFDKRASDRLGWELLNQY